jgi:diguanylate cyclase (GGDEF)-like protein
VAAVQAGGRPVRLVHNPLHGNGVNNTFELEASPLFDADGRLYGVIEVARDITDRLRIEEELRASQSHLYRLAHHDSLTGLPNRLLFRDRLDQAVVKAQRRRSRVAVLFLDLDRFKTINDTLGHDVGDALLVEVAGRLQRQCRQSDTVARLGGDEFVFVLDDIARAEDAAVVAAKILASLERPVTAAGRELAVATSIGIALYPDHAATADELIKYADRALYTAKDQGRGRFLFYREDLPGPGSRPRIGAEALRRALAGDQLAVDYLPRFAADAAPAAPLQLAALVRWRHPELGDLPADEWLAAAGECGLLAKIDEWIVERVCADLRAWREAGWCRWFSPSPRTSCSNRVSCPCSSGCAPATRCRPPWWRWNWPNGCSTTPAARAEGSCTGWANSVSAWGRTRSGPASATRPACRSSPSATSV